MKNEALDIARQALEKARQAFYELQIDSWKVSIEDNAALRRRAFDFCGDMQIALSRIAEVEEVDKADKEHQEKEWDDFCSKMRGMTDGTPPPPEREEEPCRFCEKADEIIKGKTEVKASNIFDAFMYAAHLREDHCTCGRGGTP